MFKTNQAEYPPNPIRTREACLAPDRDALLNHVHDLLAEIGKSRFRGVDEVRGIAHALGAAIAILYEGDDDLRNKALGGSRAYMVLACEETLAILKARGNDSQPQVLGRVAPAGRVPRRERDHAPRR